MLLSRRGALSHHDNPTNLHIIAFLNAASNRDGGLECRLPLSEPDSGGQQHGPDDTIMSMVVVFIDFVRGDRGLGAQFANDAFCPFIGIERFDYQIGDVHEPGPGRAVRNDPF